MLNTKILNTVLCASVIIGATLSAQTFAESAAEDAIKYRQSVFTAIRWHFGSMGAMLRDKKPYDAEQFKHHATQVSALAHMPREGFIEGSDFGDTKAKAEIWENLDDVSARFDVLIKDTAILAAAAGGDMDAVKGPFGTVAKSCKGCHDKYREE